MTISFMCRPIRMYRHTQLSIRICVCVDSAYRLGSTELTQRRALLAFS